MLPLFLELNMESTSSKNITEGLSSLTRTKRVLINSSLSPTHFDIRHEELMLKNLQPDSTAHASPKRVLPLSGVLKRRIPLLGDLNPVNMSGCNDGKITLSHRASLAELCPTMSENLVVSPDCMTLLRIISPRFWSIFLNESSLGCFFSKMHILSSWELQQVVMLPGTVCMMMTLYIRWVMMK